MAINRSRRAIAVIEAENLDLDKVAEEARISDLKANSRPAKSIGWTCPDCGEANLDEDCKCVNCGHIHCSE